MSLGCKLTLKFTSTIVCECVAVTNFWSVLGIQQGVCIPSHSYTTIIYYQLHQHISFRYIRIIVNTISFIIYLTYSTIKCFHIIYKYWKFMYLHTSQFIYTCIHIILLNFTVCLFGYFCSEKKSCKSCDFIISWLYLILKPYTSSFIFGEFIHL